MQIGISEHATGLPCMEKRPMTMSKVTPFLWFEKDAETAARFYVSLLPDSRVNNVTAMAADSPSGPAGSVQVVEFTLHGAPFLAMNAGDRPSPFTNVVSFMIQCDTQEEIDRLWTAHLNNGGKEQVCGWLTDKWGLSWQITPRTVMEMMKSPDRKASKRSSEAMMKMVKLDIAGLERAFRGD
jgi:predicted 3-demethylubiquinone-9 3-methyltransferase (glyoxalase superfamily)